jgi:DNA-binding IclR family transcriptional regulator
MVTKIDLPRSVERVFAILETLDGSHRALNVSEVSRRLGIPKSSTHLLMVALERIGYVTRNYQGRGYTLALKAYCLGRQATENLSLPRIALPHVRALAQETGLAGHLAILEKHQAVYVQKVNGPSLIPFDTYVGKRTNLHCTAVGKVLLAFGPEPARRKFLSKICFAQHTPRTITSAACLKRELELVKAQQFAFDDREEELEVRCLAVPVFNRGGEFVAALGVTGTSGQIEPADRHALAAVCTLTAKKIYEWRRSSGPQEDSELDRSGPRLPEQESFAV